MIIKFQNILSSDIKIDNTIIKAHEFSDLLKVNEDSLGLLSLDKRILIFKMQEVDMEKLELLEKENVDLMKIIKTTLNLFNNKKEEKVIKSYLENVVENFETKFNKKIEIRF
ncbi:MAG: hypothetical protein ABSG25_09245 [Bryobacteraceae bacterium]